MTEVAEVNIITSQDISPAGEVAQLSHKEKVIRAMHGGKKPEIKVENEEFFDLNLNDLLDEKKKDSESLVQKLGPTLGMELQPFRNANKGKEHVVLENKDGTKLVKVDKFSADDVTRLDKAGTYQVLQALFPDRLPPSRDFSDAGETGVIVNKIKVHPQFEEARAAAENGDPKLWNEITKSYFSDVMDEANAMGIDLWNSIDGDERDNFVTNELGNQVFVDDMWLEGKDILVVKDKIFAHMDKHPEKYSVDQKTRVTANMRGLEALQQRKEPTSDKTTQRYGSSMTPAKLNTQ